MLAAFSFRYLSIADEVPDAGPRQARPRARGSHAAERTAERSTRRPPLLDSSRRRIRRRAHTSGDRIAGVPRPSRAGRRRDDPGGGLKPRRSSSMPVVTRRELLEAGVHFGHQTRRWNPKMQRYLYGERSGIYIIDLEKSLSGLEETYEFVQGLGRRRGIVLFIGTKKQAQEVVAGAREPRRHALREQPLARRHAHELHDDLQAAAPPARAPRDGAIRRDRLPPQEGGHPPAPRAREARAQPRRASRTSSACPTPSSWSTRRRSTSPSPRRASWTSP